MHAAKLHSLFPKSVPQGQMPRMTGAARKGLGKGEPARFKNITREEKGRDRGHQKGTRKTIPGKAGKSNGQSGMKTWDRLSPLG